MKVGDTVYMPSFFMLDPVPCIILEIGVEMIKVKTDQEEGGGIERRYLFET